LQVTSVSQGHAVSRPHESRNWRTWPAAPR
jgi:hypothetical protein